MTRRKFLSTPEIILPLADTRRLSPFHKKVLRVVSRIKHGTTLSYADVARLSGSPRAFRAVGTVLKTYDSSKFSIPCHRVIKSDGSLGEYRWGRRSKKKLLLSEGIVLKK